MRSRLAALLATGTALLVLGACGGDGESAPRGGLPASTVLVTQSDVLKYDAHTPRRSFMAWWRAMQYTDGPGYLAMLAEPLRKARRRDLAYRVQLPIIARYVEAAFPHFQNVVMSGDRATVYVEIEFRRLVGADKYASTRVPQAFPMVRENRTWRIADDLFVEAGVDPEVRRRIREQGPASVAQTGTVTVERAPQAVPGLPSPGATGQP